MVGLLHMPGPEPRARATLENETVPSPRTLLLSLLVLTALPWAVTRAMAARAPELVFLHYWTDALSCGIDEMSTAYNHTNPDLPLRIVGFEHESFKHSILSMLNGDGGPDMFTYWAGARTRKLAEQDDIEPNDRVWNGAGLDKVFPPLVRNACTYDGQRYGLPITLHYVAFFYNKAIFRKYGIDPPVTWDQFTAACRILRAAGIPPVALGSRERWPAQFWFDYLLLRTAGPKYRERLLRGDADYDDPEVSRALCQWRRLLENGTFNSQCSQLGWAEAARLVRTGGAAMTLTGTWVINLFEGRFGWKPEEDFDFFPFPAMDDGVPRTALGAIDVILVPRRGRADRADRVLAYFASPGPQMETSRCTGALAPSQEVPRSFYSPFKRRILDAVRAAPHWALNFDLAASSAVAELGLDAFKLLVDNPDDLREIQSRLAENARSAYAERQP